MWATWWVWVAGGVAIGVLELLVPAYVFLGFALGALATGALVGVGMVGSLPLALMAFGALSLGAWAGMRALLGKRAGDVKIITRDINEN
jgi:membrane protein implicated in regulation of membrane protease activity